MEPTSGPAPLRYLPPPPAPPASPERPAGPDEPPAGVAPRRRGADELPPPPPPLPLPPAGQEVSAAGDAGDGPRRLPETAVPEAAAGDGGPGDPAAGAGGEGVGDPSETRSVCSSRSSSSGGGDQRAGHQHQHHQPICKICFQGPEQVRPGGTTGRGRQPRRAGLALGVGWVSPATTDLSAPRTALASRGHRWVARRVPPTEKRLLRAAFPFP